MVDQHLQMYQGIKITEKKNEKNNKYSRHEEDKNFTNILQRHKLSNGLQKGTLPHRNVGAARCFAALAQGGRSAGSNGYRSAAAQHFRAVLVGNGP